MANPSTANEPSMEEILASIRQIISEDGEPPSADRKQARNADPAEQDGPPDTELAAAAPSAAPPRPDRAPDQGGSMRPQNSESLAKTGPQPVPATLPPSNALTEARRAPEPQSTSGQAQRPMGAQRNPAEERGSLLSDHSNAAVAGAFGTLTHTILAEHARTLDDLVAEMLRPMLKEWLDDNLPPLVERLVKEEIERVSRGRR